MVDPLALGRQELDELGAAVLLGGPEHLDEVGAEAGCIARGLLGHVHSFEVAGVRGLRVPSSVSSGRGRGGGAPL